MYDLECLGVSKRFGAFTAVDDVTFRIASGSFFSILGPSGCGKTTLMRMIAGFEEPASGDIRIKGNSVLSTPPNRRNVKMVFQHLALFPMMNVGENIAYGLRCRGTPRAEIRRKVDDVLARIGLPGVAEKDISQLSGGQKQRIAIARCMVLEPDVLLLDEPLGALDLKLRERMKIELKLLQHQFETTFVYITHDQSEALVMSDQVAVMNAGRFEQIGTPQELYHAPASAFVAGFVGDSMRWQGRVVAARPEGLLVDVPSGLTLNAVRHGGNGLTVGDAVELFVRPTAIAISRAGAASTALVTAGAEGHGARSAVPAWGSSGEDGVNRLSGSVDSLLFNGADSRVLVRTEGGELVQAALPATDAEAAFTPGEAVELSFAQRHTICFPQAA